MNKNIPKKSARDHRFVIILAIILAGLLVLVAVILALEFRHHQQTILDSQKDRLINITESVANNIEVYLESFQRTAENLTALQQFQTAEDAASRGSLEPMNDFLAQAIQGRTDEISYACFTLGDTVCEAGTRKDYSLHRNMGSDSQFQKLAVMTDETGSFYFRLSAASAAGGELSLLVPMQKVYEKTASYIQMGENGYVMIKDSRGIILMHQVEAQIGIDVLADRKKKYPDFDYSELEVLVGHQLKEETGVEIYRSYWWAENPPRPTQKVSAYQPVHLADDFLSISAVIDYSEITSAVQNSAMRILLITILLVTIFLIFLLFLWNAVTKRIKFEKENAYLKQVNEQLEQLHRQEETLSHQQRLQLIGTMTGGIAHEFNNLLTPIMGYSTLILSGMSKEDENYEDMCEILDSAEKAKEIIDQITQFSRKNAEKMFQPTHIGEAIRKALIITEAVKPKNITILSNLDAEKDVCMGNPVQIHQMIVNLCNNAIYAMEGGGSLTIEGQAIKPKHKKDPFFRGKEKKWFYRISILDTGYGMNKETLDQIFIPFFTTKKPGEGTGLGLAIVQRLVDAHDGLIRVTSEEGKGTCFTIYLPVLEKYEKITVENYH